MTSEELMAATRDVLRDNKKPPLYSDSTILRALNEAQDRFARLTHSFVESTRTLGLTAGEDLYLLDDDIVLVYSVSLEGYTGRLIRSTEAWLPDTAARGRPQWYTTDKDTQSIRFYQAPDLDYTAILRISRLPAALSLSDPCATCEVKARDQVALADWAAYRCLTQDDPDGRNDNAAALAKARFGEAINLAKAEGYRFNTGRSARARGNRIK